MPWMPEVFTAPIAEARRAQEAKAEGTNDAVPYYEGILADEPDALVGSFAARQPVLDDPRVGRVEGARELYAFASGTAEWLRERDAVVENVALTRTPTRTVEEVVLNLLADKGERVELPVAVVADRNPDRTVKVVRVYHSTWPLTGEHRVRPPLLPADPNLHAEGAPGEYQRALAEGDLAGIVATFEPDGYAREPSGAAYLHRGTEALYEAYGHMFANAGGIGLEHCTLTDDGIRCAIEYNGMRWGDAEIPPQAGVAVYERGGSGLLAAARIYDDVEPPSVSDTSIG
jgi:SnoaL-like protein